MQKSKSTKLLLMLATLFFTIQFNAQAQRGPQIKSPEINSNNSVTFRLLAADANKVTLACNLITESVNETLHDWDNDLCNIELQVGASSRDYNRIMKWYPKDITFLIQLKV